jgi:diguanylate cyclase (GGDEF)-like protein
MSILEPYADASQSATERLLETSWEGRERQASQRELVVEASAAALFVVAAVVQILTGGVAGLRPEVAVLLIAVYAVVGRIEFPVGAGFVVPTQLILVPMLLMLPPAVVPAAVAIGLVSGNVVECTLGRVPPRRILSAVPDAWHAVGPAAVLLVAGAPRIGFGQLPLLAAAFAAGCIVDLTGSMVRMRFAGVVPDFKLQMRVIALVWSVDASLAPLGFLAATAARQGYAAILFVLPLVFLLWLLARDRSQRIDQAHHRLKLVEQERARLQTAVRRLGDAFAAKLELSGLLEILLTGSIEALDAEAARLTLGGGAEAPLELTAGETGALARPESAELPVPVAAPVQTGEAGAWTLSLPMHIAASPRPVTGVLRFVRRDRAFESDEIALIAELISKAELSAAEIIAHEAIRQQVVTDPLTGLGNRRKLSVDLAAALHECSPARPSLLLLFDLDGFKDYNDTFGHLAGDALLTRLGAKLDEAVAGFGAAYRLGGDEFCAHVRLDGEDSDALIHRAAAALSEAGVEFSIEASLGVVVLPHEADSADHALQLADERMYANKRSRSAARSQVGEVLVRTMRAKQPELDEHSSNVAELATRVARRLGLGGEELDEIARAAELHDIGKVGIPDAILNKPTGLTDTEWEFIYQHTILGERILHGAPALRPVARLVRASHERWDGTGYPDRLRGEEIPLGARIVSVCDAYEAMTANRSYRPAIEHEVACEELRGSAATQFDPAVVEAFLAEIDNADETCELDAAQDAAAHVRMLLDSAPAAG